MKEVVVRLATRPRAVCLKGINRSCPGDAMVTLADRQAERPPLGEVHVQPTESALW